MMNENIVESLSLPSQYVEIEGSRIHYVEEGHGNPILFLHGIPTSCYVWRNIMPHLAMLGRCIAPDLIGFGKSDKPNIEYTIFDHVRYIEKFIEKLGLKAITLIMHGWGSVIGFDYAMRHEQNCNGLVFYEAFLRPFSVRDISLPYQEQLALLHHLPNANELILNGPFFIDTIFPQTIMTSLSQKEMSYYRQSFLTPGSGKPIVQYLKELPNGDGKGQVDKLIANYSDKLTHSLLPKLMVYSVPGFITTIETAMWAKHHLPHLEVVEVGEELHLAQESCPKFIGETISVWLQGVEQSNG